MNIFLSVIYLLLYQQSVLAFFGLNSEDYYNSNSYNQGVFSTQYQNQPVPNNNSLIPSYYKSPMVRKEKRNINPEFKHKPYTRSIKQTQVSNAPYLEANGKRANSAEIERVKRYYRHVNMQNKLPAQNFINIHFLYAPLLSVSNFSETLKYDDRFEQEAISQFIKQYQSNINSSSDINLDSMNLGLTFSYGTRKSYDILTEWQVFLFQGRYIGDDDLKGDEANFQVQYLDGDDEISASYSNIEYIQRTIGIHYNIYKEYVDLLKDSPNRTVKRIVPYIMGGVGLSSQFEFLRLSNGRLGLGGLTGGRTTKQDFFNIKPSFGAALGMRYIFNNTISLDARIATIQVLPDINMRNFNLQMGVRFYF